MTLLNEKHWTANIHNLICAWNIQCSALFNFHHYQLQNAVLSSFTFYTIFCTENQNAAYADQLKGQYKTLLHYIVIEDISGDQLKPLSSTLKIKKQIIL